MLQEDPHRNTKRLRFLESCFQNWWQEWFRTCFADLLPIKKWKTRERNLRVDDIVLIQYLQKYSKPEHRLARVLNVKPDEKGLIRTVTVGYRSRSKDENPRENFFHGYKKTIVPSIYVRPSLNLGIVSFI